MSSKHAMAVAVVGLMSARALHVDRRRPRTSPPYRPRRCPRPGVPQVMTLEAKFVRASYNREGYVILGYQASNHSVGRGVDAPRGRRDSARRRAELSDHPRRVLARNA
jgi:hypothetical protein